MPPAEKKVTATDVARRAGVRYRSEEALPQLARILSARREEFVVAGYEDPKYSPAECKARHQKQDE